MVGLKRGRAMEWPSVRRGLACFGFELEIQVGRPGVGDVGGEGGLHGVAVIGRQQLFEAAGVHGAGVGVGGEVGAVGIDEFVDDDAIGPGGGAVAFAVIRENLEFAAGVGGGDCGLAPW